jgi:hypothetical protein
MKIVFSYIVAWSILLASCTAKDCPEEPLGAAVELEDSLEVDLSQQSQFEQYESSFFSPDMEYYILERLPIGFDYEQLMPKLRLKKKYLFDLRMNPMYLEDDFNGDGFIDLAIPIKEESTDKKGFAIIHGNTNEIFILGAGREIVNGLSDDQSYVDGWRINREKINHPGIEEETGNGAEGELLLENNSIEIFKSEVGGGIIYWNGKTYAYFHQTC